MTVGEPVRFEFERGPEYFLLHVDDDPQVTALCKRQLEGHTEHITVAEWQDPTRTLDAFD